MTTWVNLNRNRSYTQGMTQDQKDEIDGERDALRVIAGLDPFWPLNKAATAAYRAGWDRSAQTALEGVAV